MYIEKYNKKHNKLVCQGIVLDVYRALEYIDDSKANWTEERAEKFVDIVKELKAIRRIYDDKNLSLDSKKDLSIQNKFDDDIFLAINSIIDNEDYYCLNTIIDILKNIDIDATSDDYVLKMSIIKFSSNRYMLMALKADLEKSLEELDKELLANTPAGDNIRAFIDNVDVRINDVNDTLDDLKNGKLVKNDSVSLEGIVKDLDKKIVKNK